MSSLKEAFEEFDELDDIYYDIDNKQDIEKLKNVLDNEEEDDLDNLEMIVDVDAEDEEELKDSYVGELLLYCPSCHTIHYAKKEDIIEDEENPEIVNVGEQCPHCDATEGFEIVGEVAPYNDDEVEETEDNIEIEDEFDLTDEDDLEDEQNFEENLKSGKQKSILERLLEDDFSQSNIDKDGKPLDLEGDDDTIEEKVGSVLPRVKKQVKEHKTTKTTKKSLKESKLVEKPLYDLKPRYDARQSFYNKATVDTGDDGKQNKLYSYNTLVAEIKDGKPIVYGTYSATTLRHIKDWLKQNGFKADSKAQIEKDYMTEGCKTKKCNLKEEVQEEAYAIADYVYEKIKDKDLVEWDEFEDLVNEATKELYGVDLYNEVDDDYKVTINDKEFDVNDLVNGDIRGILSFEGYATIFEGEHEGGLTTKEIEESLKESKSLKEGYQDVIADILERAKMNVDEGYAVDEAIFDAIDNGLIYTNDQFDILKSLFNLDDLYTSNGENAAQLVDEHIFNEIYNEVSDYFNEKNGEVEESLKKEHRTVEQIKESIKSKLDKVLKESVSKEDDIDAKADDKKEVAKEKEEKAIDDADADKDYEEDEIDESLFDNLINKYCTRVYENVKDYKTTNGYNEEGKLVLEGLLTYKSGKTTNTKFIFEKKMSKDDKVKYVGLNETFAKSKKAFALNCKIDNKKIISESLTYNYKVKVDDSKKVVYGSIKNN